MCVSNKEPKIDLKQANETTRRGRMQNGVIGPGGRSFNCGAFCRHIILFVLHTFGNLDISQCVSFFSSCNCEVMHTSAGGDDRMRTGNKETTLSMCVVIY